VNSVRKAAGIAFLLLSGLSVVLAVSYLLLLVQFELPLGPPLVLLGLVALSFVLVARLAGRR
jgi:CHASE2 domain-containing sensor protein